jgi:hypothetical protein
LLVEGPGDRDWLAVLAVSCELVSALNSLFNREKTGNFTLLRPIGAERSRKNAD